MNYLNKVKLKSSLSMFVLSGVFYTGIATATGGGVITNGTINIGVHNEGNLVVGGVGLEYIPTGGEAVAPGCACEGWGVADAVSGRFGQAGVEFGYDNIVNESFTMTASTATSIVKVSDAGGDLVRVTHDFKPSASINLYEVEVSIENISGADISDLRYRRTMDWDVPPTEFLELSTLVTGGASNVLFSSDDGFAEGNPLSGNSSLFFSGEATDNGPEDHGALFDLGFGALADTETIVFSIFYGATDNETAALNALITAGSENVYSLGKPDPSDPNVGTDGSPNTFIFGFKGVGGKLLVPTQIPTLSSYGIILLSLMLVGLGNFRKKKQA